MTDRNIYTNQKAEEEEDKKKLKVDACSFGIYNDRSYVSFMLRFMDNLI